MLYETRGQLSVFLMICIVGFLSAILFDLKNIITFKFKKWRFLTHFFDFFCIFCVFLCYLLTNLEINFGEQRLFVIIGFWLAFSIERFFSTNFVAKPLTKCYNVLKEKINDKRRRSKQKEKV